MDDDDLFTPESLAQFRLWTTNALGPGIQLLQEYRKDREAELANSPDLQTWINSLEEADISAASNAGLWSRMSAQSYIEFPTPKVPHEDHGVFVVRIISPKVFDAFRDRDKPDMPRSNYAFTTVKVCLRRDAIPDGLAVPQGWSNPALIDTELFELPPYVTEDMFDDLEKIHIIYLAATVNGQFVCKPVYIGIGTGEAYGTGPRQRTTRGRYRLYRYDVKNNFQLEYVRLTQGQDTEMRNVQSLPPIPPIGDKHATLLLAKSAADSNFMSVSDPEVARHYSRWLQDHPENQIVYREITLEKVNNDLCEDSARSTIMFQPNDVVAVLAHAWNVQRWYYVAWQHPDRLSTSEGIDLYYDLLPAFRREEYEIKRFRKDLFDLPLDDPSFADLTVPRVLRSAELRRQLQAKKAGVVDQLDQWLQDKVVRDLYAYGNHPELRLCTAIAFWKRLSSSGLWSATVESAYRKRLFEIELSTERICADPALDEETL
jgi:hypothetical protein